MTSTLNIQQINTPIPFKRAFSLESRKRESALILSKYSDKRPIICERASNAKNVKDMTKKKFLVPTSMTVGQFMHVIRTRISMPPEQALFFFIKNNIPSSSESIGNIYAQFADRDDGFLYVAYTAENTFGWEVCADD